MFNSIYLYSTKSQQNNLKALYIIREKPLKSFTETNPTIPLEKSLGDNGEEKLLQKQSQCGRLSALAGWGEKRADNNR